MSSLSLFIVPLVATLTAAPPAEKGEKGKAEKAEHSQADKAGEKGNAEKAEHAKGEGAEKAKAEGADKGEKAKPAKGEVSVTWLGHATFELVSPGGTKILIDPFITNNPATPADRKNLDSYKPDAILLSHSHFDHTADAVAIATKSGAKVIGAFDHVASLKLPEAQTMGGNVGGKLTVGDVTVHIVPAVHGSDPGGRPVGFIIEAGGKSIYHTGDTWLFGDMSLIQEIYKPTVLLFQVGGGPYNQDPKTAALAIKKYFKPKMIIPMHFGTWPVLASEDDVKAAFKGDKRLNVMKPGDTVKL